MDEDEDGLLPASDDESISENEDHCLPVEKPADNYRHSLIYLQHTKTEFLTIKIILIVATLGILILFPLYVETINVSGDVYSLLLTNTLFSAIILAFVTVTIKFTFSKYRHIPLLKLPISLPKLLQIVLIYFLSAVIITYSLDRKRVVCHLQDPLKQLALVWSFLYYFFFCQRFMCLQRIFSATVIIVGLFIALDYSLCNEFKCRGYERERVSDDRGNWSWQTHAVWTSVYVGGLALLAGYFTMLEQTFIDVIKNLQNGYSAPFLYTVSRSVSTISASSSRDETEERYSHKKINVIHMGMWMHVIGFFVVAAFYWTDFVPQIGKGSNGSAVLNYTLNGILCHFTTDADCKNLAIISWLFLCVYLVFVVVSIRFLMLTQSAVYTVATMSTALPLAGIWWSLAQMVPIKNGLVLWEPSFTGDLFSSLLGLPIILIGLYFLYKSHGRDCQWSRVLTNPVSTGHMT